MPRWEPFLPNIRNVMKPVYTEVKPELLIADPQGIMYIVSSNPRNPATRI